MKQGAHFFVVAPDGVQGQARGSSVSVVWQQRTAQSRGNRLSVASPSRHLRQSKRSAPFQHNQALKADAAKRRGLPQR